MDLAHSCLPVTTSTCVYGQSAASWLMECCQVSSASRPVHFHYGASQSDKNSVAGVFASSVDIYGSAWAPSFTQMWVKLVLRILWAAGMVWQSRESTLGTLSIPVMLPSWLAIRVLVGAVVGDGALEVNQCGHTHGGLYASCLGLMLWLLSLSFTLVI